MSKIVIKSGDIFKDPSQAIVNPVNCVGVMGKGLALQFKNRFKHNFMLYSDACKRGEVVTGKMFITENPIPGIKYIINFPTKSHWRDPSKLEYIRRGLDDLVEQIAIKDITSISIPALGCGLGGLKWGPVRHLMMEKLANVPEGVTVTIYAPDSK